jgi:cation diffusion facilitator family transporter
VTGSPALMADGVHSLSDLLSDGVTLYTMELSRRPQDATQPYGYGRMETMGALGVSTLLVATGAGIGLHSLETLRALAAGELSLHGPMWVAVGAAAVSLVAKEALYHVTRRAGERANSKVMLANAWHHRSDAASSAIAIVGASGAMVGGGAVMLDPLAGMLVSALIINTGWQIGRDRYARPTLTLLSVRLAAVVNILSV